jgi:hypothetical protein
VDGLYDVQEMKTLRHPLRFVVAATLILVVTLCVFFAVLIFGAFDTVESSYQTKEDAKADRLFERGWLPCIIPESSSDIKVSSNLDIDTSVGSFHFNPKELDEFIRSIKSTTAQDTRLMGEYPRMKLLSDRGYVCLYYRDNGTVWRFFIHRDNGHCEYWAHNI